MKNQFITSTLKKLILAILFLEVFSFNTHANPGDTTWVTVYNLKKLTYYGNYDTTAIFPTGKRYRKIRLHYILGRYACPGSPQYCGSWDYTTQIFARPAGMDSVEIAKVITPYATDWLQQNKSHDYVVDITDYAPALQGSTGMRFRYDGYSWGFTITLKIEFIEGVPPMDALKVENVYKGYFPYGNNSNPIENYLVPKTFSYTPTTARIFLKNSISGHGADNTGCAEFCSKYYQLRLNNSLVSQTQLWRIDCGENQVYPQTGTWIYNRSNWCPGAVVWPLYHDLSSITTANTTYTVDIDMQPYVGSGSLGGYIYETQLVHYSAPNNTRDVSIEEILAPTRDPNFVRQNPRCSSPLIKIRNTGTDNVTSIAFNYGVKGGSILTYTWTGSLNFLDTTTIVFPSSPAALTTTALAVFEVSVTAVNNVAGDDNLFNNIYRSQFLPTAVFPKSFVVRLLTNNAASDNFWTLYDDMNNTIVTSGVLTNATVHRDTILNMPPGCYRLTLNDFSCDGLNWWANPNAGAGNLRIDKVDANASVFYFPWDFGCSFTKHFVVLADPPPIDTTSVENLNQIPNVIEVFPNPAGNLAYIKLDLSSSLNVSYKVTDINGRVISSKTLGKISAQYEMLDISEMSNGVYLVVVELEGQVPLTKKLVIQK